MISQMNAATYIFLACTHRSNTNVFTQSLSSAGHGHVVMWVIHVVLKKYFWYIAEHNGVSLIFDLLRITEKGELEMINIKRELFPVWREDSVIKHFIVLRSILKGESVFTGEGGDSHSYNIDERITQCWFYRNTFGVGTGIYLIMSLYLQVGMSFMFEFNMSLT